MANDRNRKHTFPPFRGSDNRGAEQTWTLSVPYKSIW